MATVNKQSVREEVDRLKDEFDKLSSDKKITTECRVLMKSMFILINLILSIFLEKTTKKNSNNSSIPPSQTEEDETTANSNKTNGKGKDENNATASNSRTNETVTVSEVNACDICGKDLSDEPCQHVERRTKIDIVFEKIVEHVDAEIKICPDCDVTVKLDSGQLDF